MKIDTLKPTYTVDIGNEHTLNYDLQSNMSINDRGIYYTKTITPGCNRFDSMDAIEDYTSSLHYFDFETNQSQTLIPAGKYVIEGVIASHDCVYVYVKDNASAETGSVMKLQPLNNSLEPVLSFTTYRFFRFEMVTDEYLVIAALRPNIRREYLVIVDTKTKQTAVLSKWGYMNTYYMNSDADWTKVEYSILLRTFNPQRKGYELRYYNWNHLMKQLKWGTLDDINIINDDDSLHPNYVFFEGEKLHPKPVSTHTNRKIDSNGLFFYKVEKEERFDLFGSPIDDPDKYNYVDSIQCVDLEKGTTKEVFPFGHYSLEHTVCHGETIYTFLVRDTDGDGLIDGDDFHNGEFIKLEPSSYNAILVAKFCNYSNRHILHASDDLVILESWPTKAGETYYTFIDIRKGRIAHIVCTDTTEEGSVLNVVRDDLIFWHHWIDIGEIIKHQLSCFRIHDLLSQINWHPLESPQYFLKRSPE